MSKDIESSSVGMLRPGYSEPLTDRNREAQGQACQMTQMRKSDRNKFALHINGLVFIQQVNAAARERHSLQSSSDGAARSLPSVYEGYKLH